MKDWHTAMELAGLPAMPGTKAGVIHRATNKAWPSRPRKGKGGGREYHISALPEVARQALIEREIQAAPAPIVPASAPEITPRNEAAPLKDWQVARMDARAALLAEVARIGGAIGVEAAIREIVRLAQDGALPPHLQRLVPAANGKGGNGGKRTLSVRTIKRWRAANKAGTTALAPQPSRRESMPAWGAAMLKQYRQPQKPSIAAAIRLMGEAGVDPLPSYDSARRFLAKVGEVEKRRGRMGPRELKSTRPFKRRDTGHMLPADCYTADGHTFDGEVAHPIHGRPFRPEVTSVMDLATRRAVGWSCTLAESGLAVLDALRHACTRHGIPALFYSDNGPGYVNEMMTDAAVGFFARLGIEHTTSLPYNSQARGLSERAHQSILVDAAKRLPTYVGADMDPEARQIAFKQTRAESSKNLLISWPDFCALIDRACLDYNTRPHRALVKITDPVTGKRRHSSPDEAWDASIAQGWAPVMPEDSDGLWRPRIERKVSRGEVNLFGNRYFSHGLEEWHGQTVHVAYDVWDGTKIWVHDLDGRLIAVAEADANVTEYFPQSRIDQARETRAKGRLKRLKNHTEEVRAELGEVGFAQSPEPEPLRPEQQEAAAAKFAELEAPAENNVVPLTRNGRPVFFTDMEKFRWLTANPEAVEWDDREWIADYHETSEYRLMFGPEDSPRTDARG